MLLRNISRVLLLRKTSRLNYERTKYIELSEEQFKKKLIENGSDYEGLLNRHTTHEHNVQLIHHHLLRQGIDVILRNRDTIQCKDIECSDAVLAAGGDGNFLTAASYITTPHKLLIGINTDVERSEGHLCITPTSCYPINTIIDHFIKGMLKYIKRQRLSISINGETLPVLALNEAFIGETDPSQVSYFELSHGSEWTKYNSSGLLVYTGTGSTSWAYNINKITTSTVQQLMNIMHELGLMKDTTVQWPIEDITQTYNNNSIYHGDENSLMSFVIREGIDQKRLLETHPTSGKFSSLKVKSRSWKTQLIIDGQYIHNFPNGAEAHFTLGPQYLLSTAIKPQTK